VETFKAICSFLFFPAQKACNCFRLIIALSLTSTSFAQTHWLKHSQNPVLTMSPGTFDSDQVFTGPVLFENNQFKMWYGASATPGRWNTEYAISVDGVTWVKQSGKAVLELGPQNSWDDQWAIAGAVIHKDDTYKMWYYGWSSFDDKRRIGLATSSDGISWQKYDDPATTEAPFANSDPVLDAGESSAWNSSGVWYPSVFFDGTIYHMWFSGQSSSGYASLRVGYATSPDGINWALHPSNPVLQAGAAGSWESLAVGTASVVVQDNKYHIWYAGMNNAGLINARLGYAVSDDGVTWQKHSSNPIVQTGDQDAWDADRIDSPFVLFHNEKFHMWYAGKDAGNKGRVGYAVDFTNIPHSDSIELGKTFVAPAIDTLICTTRIVNFNDKVIDVLAIIESLDKTFSDSLHLSDQGEGIWKAIWPIPGGERTYNMYIKVKDLDDGTNFDGSAWSIQKRVTSVGPVAFDRFSISTADSILNPGDRVRYDLSIKNTGAQATAENISVRVYSKIPCVLSNPQTKSFGNIAHGESVTTENFSLRVAEECNENKIQMKLSIFSNEVHFWSDSFQVNLFQTSVSEMPHNILTFYKLDQNYPNPFNPTTTIEYALPKSDHVRIAIYDMLGRHVCTLVDSRQLAGQFQTSWDGRDEHNIPVAAGIYFYKIQAGDFVQVNKLALLR